MGPVTTWESWHTLWRHVLGAVVVCVLGWYAFVQGERVPVLGLADLGIHELGHLLTMPFPDVVTAVMGNGLQFLAPLCLSVYFLLARRDLLGAGLCLAWAGTAAQDASVYIADAPTRQLQLIGGEHDWAYVLGEHFDALDMAAGIATVVRVTGAVLLVAGLVACLYAALFGLERGRLRPGGSEGGRYRPARLSPGHPFETAWVGDPANASGEMAATLPEHPFGQQGSASPPQSL